MRSKVFISILLVAYFVFTSGLVFKFVPQNTMVNDIPYAISLNARDTGLIASYEYSDIRCMEWIKKHEGLVTCDVNAYFLLCSNIPQWRLKWPPDYYYRYNFVTPCDVGYVFVSAWSNRTHKIVDVVDKNFNTPGTGLRIISQLPEIKLPIVYKDGDSIIYEQN